MPKRVMTEMMRIEAEAKVKAAKGMAKVLLLVAYTRFWAIFR
jgi:hypothetical protein